MMGDASIMTGYVKGCVGSAAAMLFASVADKADGVCRFVLDDAEQAGYFYHDLTQMLGQRDTQDGGYGTAVGAQQGFRSRRRAG